MSTNCEPLKSLMQRYSLHSHKYTLSLSLIQIRGNHITRTVKDIYNSPYLQSGSPPKSLKMIEEVLYTLLTLLET